MFHEIYREVPTIGIKLFVYIHNHHSNLCIFVDMAPNFVTRVDELIIHLISFFSTVSYTSSVFNVRQIFFAQKLELSEKVIIDNQ